MKWFITFIIATLILWGFLIGSIGTPFLKMLANISLNGTPLFIHTEDEAFTVAKWMLGITGLMAAGFGAQIADVVCDWERFIERLFEPGRRRRY